MRPVLVLAAVIVVACVGIAGAQTAPPGEPTLTVHGQGRVKVPPDRASLTVEVVTSSKTLEAATAAHRERTERAAKALQDMQGDGLKIEHSTFQLNENRPPVPPGTAPQGRTDYRAVTTFQLTLTQIGKVDQVVTAIAATGLFEVRNIAFGIGDRDPGLKTARQKAVEDAREKATTYAEAAGVQLGGVLRIEDSEVRPPMPYVAAPMQQRSVQVVPPETLTLSASVTMTWRIAAKP